MSNVIEFAEIRVKRKRFRWKESYNVADMSHNSKPDTTWVFSVVPI